MTDIKARVLLDSISPEGERLTTMEVTGNRFILAEFNTHRMFSRNSASSRAIPLKKQMERITEDLAYPAYFPAEQPGMQGGDLIGDQAKAESWWRGASQSAVFWAEQGGQLGIHKSAVNRVLEPFMWHTIIVSSTDWDNFFRQRCSPLAQPEMRLLAEAMEEALKRGRPKQVWYGDWHMPLIHADDWEWANDTYDDSEQARVEALKMISVARCARVSYLTHDGIKDHSEDITLYHRLTSADPPHASPLEHVATPVSETLIDVLGNFRGWSQMRHQVLGF